jgi:hypothetical protein
VGCVEDSAPGEADAFTPCTVRRLSCSMLYLGSANIAAGGRRLKVGLPSIISILDLVCILSSEPNVHST